MSCRPLLLTTDCFSLVLQTVHGFVFHSLPLLSSFAGEFNYKGFCCPYSFLNIFLFFYLNFFFFFFFNSLTFQVRQIASERKKA